jgi:ABC-2 type transport system ATP-binding protein
VIQVEQLTKRFGERTAVSGISFRIEPGEVVGFLGPNGAGKSTTLRMLTGYVTPSEGTIRIGGVDVVADPIGARRQIGYLPESVPLYREMRVEEYLRYRARLKGVARNMVGKRVDDALQLATISDVRKRIIGQLSKGYRSRVGIADALVADPPLLVLDEPTAGLDPNQIRQVRDLVRGMAGKKTVILSTHILPEVESSCGRVLIINEGHIVGEGAPGELRSKGQGAQVFSLEGRGERAKFESVLKAIEGVRTIKDVAALDNESPPLLSIRLEADAGPVDERIFSAVAAAGLVLRGLKREQSSLEDVFASLTTREPDVNAEPEASAEPAKEKS